MSDDRTTTPTPAPTKGRRRRRRTGPLVLFSLGLLVVLGELAFLSLTGRPLTIPDRITRAVETRLNAGIGSGRLSLGELQLVISRALIPRVQMTDVGVYDANGSEIARLNEIGARLAPRPLLRGAIELTAVRLSGAQITVRRRTDGTFDLTLGSGAGASGTLAGVLDGIDQAFTRKPFSDLQSITADELTITLEDSRSGRLWQVTGGSLKLDNGSDSVDLTVSADVFNGTEELATTVIGLRTQKGSPRASLTATFENAAAADIAAQAPALAFLAVLDAPISGALRASIDTRGEFEGLAGTLEVAAGALHPTKDTRPIPFEGARAYVAYDPGDQTLDFTQVTLKSGAARGTATGRALLRDFNAGWPATLVGQFALSDVQLQPGEMFVEPMTFATGAVDFRLRLDPFVVEVGQLALQDDQRRFVASGKVSAARSGWGVALDLSLNTIPLDRLLALWPVSLAAPTRDWLAQNIVNGQISDLRGAVRLFPGEEPQVSLNYAFSDAVVTPLRTLPPITSGAGYGALVGKSYTTVIEAGTIAAPQGGDIDMTGSVFHIGDVSVRQGLAELRLETESSITAALSLLDLPPFSLMTKAGLQPDLAEGRARLRSDVSFRVKSRIELPDVDYKVAGNLTRVQSDRLVKDREVSADTLEIRADRGGVSISGAGRLGKVPANVVWTQAFGPDAKGSRIEGTVDLGPAFLEEFNIGLPPGSLTGTGVAQVTLDLARDAAPRFTLQSDLNRVGLALPALGWSKPRNQTGRLEVEGRLGPAPSIDRLVLDAAGLSAQGLIDLGPDGSMRSAQFDRVRIGRWLDGPVTLQGRGPGIAPGIVVSSGTVDLRAANFAPAGGNGGGGGPIDLALDRLVVSEGIVLTRFTGRFTSSRGLDGQFTARVNGQAPISGSVVPTPSGAAVRILSDQAGETVAAAGVLKTARGGRMDLTLNPTGAEGVYNGRLAVTGTRIVGAPALTEILSAISIVGLLDQMNSGGITLNEVQAEFQLSPTRVTLYQSSAVGPSLGISLDGFYDLRNGRMDMQGVVSPVYFLNGIGQVFSRRGEGVFGFNFTIRGTSDDPSVSVNPLSILTPGMFREIFRRPPPTQESGQ